MRAIKAERPISGARLEKSVRRMKFRYQFNMFHLRLVLNRTLCARIEPGRIRARLQYLGTTSVVPTITAGSTGFSPGGTPSRLSVNRPAFPKDRNEALGVSGALNAK
jgi:hypothetical protein